MLYLFTVVIPPITKHTHNLIIHNTRVPRTQAHAKSLLRRLTNSHYSLSLVPGGFIVLGSLVPGGFIVLGSIVVYGDTVLSGSLNFRIN